MRCFVIFLNLHVCCVLLAPLFPGGPVGLFVVFWSPTVLGVLGVVLRVLPPSARVTRTTPVVVAAVVCRCFFVFSPVPYMRFHSCTAPVRFVSVLFVRVSVRACVRACVPLKCHASCAIPACRGPCSLVCACVAVCKGSLQECRQARIEMGNRRTEVSAIQRRGYSHPSPLSGADNPQRQWWYWQDCVRQRGQVRRR